MTETLRWLFGDQLGPHFRDGADQPVLLIESRKVFARRKFHRQKAHLVLSAMRHRAAELGENAVYRRADTYREALAPFLGRQRISVCAPTSRAALTFVEGLDGVEVLPARGFATSRETFENWAAAHGGNPGGRLRMEDFYRDSRRRLGLLMDGDEPVGGRWNYDAENRKPPPGRQPSQSNGNGQPELPIGPDDTRGRLGVPEPWWPAEDDIDAEVRRDLDRWAADGDVAFLGHDGPRLFPATRREALSALRHFLRTRLTAFGDYEDAMLAQDPWMAHSLLSSSLNLGLLDPVEVAERAAAEHTAGRAPIEATEGFVRQVIGWRDYMWHIYWHSEPDYADRDELHARTPLPGWFSELDADAVEARCLSSILREVADHAWVHHIPRLMVLGNYGLQRGWRPAALADWFHRAFVDGYEWVMVANVIGMSQFADGGRYVTKPYIGGGSYIDRMSDFCGECCYSPRVRVGENACPFTAGYWSFVDRHRVMLSKNPRMARAVHGADRLSDLEALVEQEKHRGSAAP